VKKDADGEFIELSTAQLGFSERDVDVESTNPRSDVMAFVAGDAAHTHAVEPIYKNFVKVFIVCAEINERPTRLVKHDACVALELPALGDVKEDQYAKRIAGAVKATALTMVAM
jgi:hypothetical protein